MGEDISFSGAKKRGREVVVDAGRQRRNVPGGVAERLEDLRLALMTVPDQIGYPSGRIVDGLAMARQEAMPGLGGEAL